MLQVDLREPDYKIAQYIKARCSGFGDVVSVTVHRSPTPFALVLMAQRIVTQQVADQYVGAAFGNSVLIHLEHKLAAADSQDDEMTTRTRIAV